MSQNKYEKVLITGASSGIGRSMALWWAQRGATVWATARRMKNLQELASQNAHIKPVEMDVSKQTELVKQIRDIDKECGGLDLIIANAGIGFATPAHLADWEHVQKALSVNVMGAAATITAVLPEMLRRGRGHVVGISSVSGYKGTGAFSSYCGSKAFLSTFLESLRVDVYGTPVKVTCIEPGFVKSEMSDRLEGRAPMYFRATSEAAAEKYGRAILRGSRRLAWPKVHAIASASFRWVPDAIYEPLAKRASMPQLEIAEDDLRQLKA